MVLLLLVYLVFIGVGLPDSLLGTAWPFMAGDFGASVDSAGLLSMTISAGIISASLTAYRITRRLGFGRAAALGLGLAAFSLSGYALSGSMWQALCVSFPLGFGSGLLQTLFNDFVARNYTARHMSWLHGAWGVGAVAGPLLVSVFSRTGAGWRGGYWAVAVVEALLLGAIFITLPRWHAGQNKEGPGPQPRAARKRPALRGKPYMVGQFFLYCSMENTIMLWGASYLIEAKGISAVTAAQGVSLFFLGITAGRFLGGAIAGKIGNMRLIAGSVAMAVALDAVLLCSSQAAVILPVFMLLGCCMAPIYPAMLHQTPSFFPGENVQLLMGVQVASAYVGILLMPPLLGKLFAQVSFWLLPAVQAACLAGVLLCVRVLKRSAEKAEAQ